MATLTIILNLDNDAFGPTLEDRNNEIARTLGQMTKSMRESASCVPPTEFFSHLMIDINGNTVGICEITREDVPWEKPAPWPRPVRDPQTGETIGTIAK